MAQRGKKVRIAIIGCGRIAREGHLPYLRKNPNVELVAAVDIGAEQRAALCKEFGIERDFDDAAAMFDQARPDGVFICTPNWAHRELTLLAAERGAHIFCEKPMAVNADEAEDMVAACDKAGVRLQIGMVKRFESGIVKAKQIAQSGRLGEVSQIYTSSLTPPARLDSAPFRILEKWGKLIGFDIIEKMGLWRLRDTRTGGGHLLEMGTHLLDLILYFADQPPAAFSGFINNKRTDMVYEDQGTLIVKFPSGLLATCELNMSVTSENLIGERGRIYGDNATLAFNHINGMWFGLPFYEYIPTQIAIYGKTAPFLGLGLPVTVNVGKKIYMHKLQVDYFVDKILGRDTDYFGFGPDFAATGIDGLHIMRIIDAAYKNA